MAAHKRGSATLPFVVQSCSGQDRDYPAEDLLSTQLKSKGWQAARFCSYPQELTLRLRQPAALTQLQLLSHEYKIATKVEIFVGSAPEGSDPATVAPEACVWKRLGSLSFDSNQRTGHAARELKSVHVSTEALLVRFLLHKCHVNKPNAYNQVGLLAVKLLGSPLAPPEEFADVENHGRVNAAQPPLTTSPPLPQQKGPAAAAPPGPANPVRASATARRISELGAAKAAAVAREDYDEAKRLKALLERLRAVEAQAAELEARKSVAVQNEDYDLAKALKAEIERLRSGAEGHTLVRGSSLEDRPLKPPPERPGPSDSQDSAAAVGVRRTASVHTDDAAAAAAAASRRPPVSPRHAGFPTPAQAYDDRPAVAMGGGAGGGALADPAPPRKAPAGRAVPQQSPHSSALGPPPEGWPADLAAPEEVADGDAKDAEALGAIAGPYVAAALYSKTWQLREAALLHLTKCLQRRAYDGRQIQALVLALGPPLGRALQDRVATVVQAGAALLRGLVAGPGPEDGPEAGARERAALVAELTPVLLARAGENGARVAATASETLLALAQEPAAHLEALASLFTRPVKTQAQWRPVLGRLQLLGDLLPHIGLAKSDGRDGFQLEALMKYVGAAFGSPNAEVRAAAVKLTLQVHVVAGPATQRLLPEGLNPKIREQLDAAWGPKARPGSPPVPSVANAQQRRLSGSGQAGAAPAAGAAAPKAASKVKAPRSGAAPAAAIHATSHFAAASPPAVRSHAIGEEGAESGPEEEDPALYEAEAAAREEALGPNHPSVAESLSHLAILYNQQGKYDLAEPLYKRALAIFEAAHGPDHPDVAHTLTDLAVLHLEQGHDEVGHPLLERALHIQEAALGPNHPDVVAIRDVLEAKD